MLRSSVHYDISQPDAHSRDMVKNSSAGFAEAALMLTRAGGEEVGRTVPTNVGLRRRLMFGFGAQTLTIILLVGERFLMVPLYLYAWGLSLYEDYLLLGAAAGFLRLMDFGLESYYSASLRMSLAAGRTDEFKRHISVGLGIYFIIVAAALVLSTLVLFVPITKHLGLSYMTETEASLILWLMLFNRIYVLPRSVLRGIYAAYGDFSRGENLFTLMSLSQALVAASLLAFKVSPTTLAIAGCVSLSLTRIPLLLDQRRRYPDLSYRPAMPSWTEFKKILKRASLYLVRDWSEVLIIQLPVILIGVLARQQGAILIFNLCRTLTGVARQFTIQLSKSGGIEMSRQLAQRDRNGVIRLYLSLGRSIGAFTGIACGVLVWTAEPLIRLLTQEKAPFDPLILAAFVAAIMLTGPGQVSTMLLHMSNVPKPLAAAAAVRIVLLVATSAILIPAFGAVGAAVALGVADVALAMWATYAATYYFRVPDVTYGAKAYGSELLGFVAGILICEFLGRFFSLNGVLSLLGFYITVAVMLVIPSWFLVMDARQRNGVSSRFASVLRTQCNRRASRST